MKTSFERKEAKKLAKDLFFSIVNIRECLDIFPIPSETQRANLSIKFYLYLQWELQSVIYRMRGGLLYRVILYEHRDNKSQSSYFITVKNNFLLFFKQWLLLDNINPSPVLRWAAYKNYEEVVKLLLEDKRINPDSIQLARQNCENLDTIFLLSTNKEKIEHMSERYRLFSSANVLDCDSKKIVNKYMAELCTPNFS